MTRVCALVLLVAIAGCNCGKKDEPLAPIAVAVAPSSSALVAGATRQLTATVTRASAVLPVQVAWSSDTATVATVDANGLVTAKGAGSATIVATYGGAQGSSAITVSALPAVVYTVSVDPPTAAVQIGATKALAATVKADGSVVTAQVQWSSDAASVASVDANGVVTGKAAGNATITASYAGAQGSSAIAVSAAPVVYAVAVSPPSASLSIGATQALAATVKANGAVVSAQVQWTSDAASVASVDANGLVTAHAAGSATITASYGGASGSSAITVNALPGPALTCINPSVVAAGTPPPLLSVYASPLDASSQLLFDGVARAATNYGSYFGSWLLDSDLATPHVAQVTVTTAGRASAAVPLAVRAVPDGYPLLISAAVDGGQPDASSYDLAVSETGRYLAFDSVAPGLVAGPGGQPSTDEVFVRDTCRGADGGCAPSTQLASTFDGGDPGTWRAIQPAISADGRYVAFQVNRPGVIFTSIFLRDTCAGAPAGCTPATGLASLAADGGPNDSDATEVSLSASGRYLAFLSRAPSLRGAPGFNYDVYVRDQCAGAAEGCTPTTVRASAALDGGYSARNGSSPRVSPDGRFVAFSSDATDLTGDFTGDFTATNAYLRDTCLGAPPGCTPSTVLVSATADGGVPDGDSNGVAPSAQGRYVAFSSSATNLVDNDTNGDDDVFVRDTCAGAPGCTPSTTLVSQHCGSQAGTARDVSISADGRFIGFYWWYSELSASPAVRDTCAGATGCLPSTYLVQPAVTAVNTFLSGDGKAFGYATGIGGAYQVFLGASLLAP